MADICGQPALTRLLRRLRRCCTLDGIILATTEHPSDDVLEDWARSENLPCYRGSEEDVLGRVVKAQQEMNSELLVEITGDCILLDPEIVDLGVETFLANECDVVTNAEKLSFPMGFAVQVYRLADLEQVERTVRDAAVREHVSLFFYEHPERYRILHLLAPARWQARDCRFQLDYAEDLRFLTEIYSRLEPVFGDAFGLEEIMNVLRTEPSLAGFNRHCEERAAR